MKASNAKLMADGINQKMDNASLQSILSQIGKRAEQGHYSFTVSGELRTNVKAKLIELGYSIEGGGRMNETEYNIKWDNVKGE